MLRTGLWALTASLLFSGCTIIIDPGDVKPGPPVPVPLQCTPIGLDPLTGEAQLLLENPPPRAQVIFSVRMTRSTANLAEVYETFMTETIAGLAATGVQVTHAVLVRADERPVQPRILAAWGCSLDSPEDLPPKDVLSYYITNAELPESPLGCVTDPLTDLGAELTTAVTEYPRQLPGKEGKSIFGSAPALVLVVHMDPLARKSAYNSSQCAAAQTISQTTPDAGAAWLAYDGDLIPFDRVVHWFIHSDEGIDEPTFRQRCLAVEGFPAAQYDALEPSALPVYTPLAAAIEESGGPAASISMCSFLASTERQRFLTTQISGLATVLGVSLNKAVLKALLEGGEFPIPGGVMPPGEDDGSRQTGD